MRHLLLLLPPLVGCTPDGDADAVDDSAVVDTDLAEAGTFRVALLADPHVIGDDYTGKEGSPLDTESIYKTQQRLRTVMGLLGEVDPAPAFGLIAGDVFHAGYRNNPSLADLLDPDKGFAPMRARQILDTSPIPLDLTWGNHDYPGPGEGRDLAHAVFQQLFDTPPYHSRVYGGWRFVYLNTQLGPSWDPEPLDGFISSGGGSLGREQLAWLAAELEQGQPTILVMHHHPLAETLLTNEDPEGPWRDVYAVVESYADVVKGAFFGHFHRWMDVEGFLGVPAWIMGGVRYDADNFWIAELDRDGTDWTILDYDKASWGTVNGYSASYAGGSVWVDQGAPAEDDPAFPDDQPAP